MKYIKEFLAHKYGIKDVENLTFAEGKCNGEQSMSVAYEGKTPFLTVLMSEYCTYLEEFTEPFGYKIQRLDICDVTEDGVNGAVEDNCECEPVNQLVDLGLPSGTLWARYNAGAASEEQYGYYFTAYGMETYHDALNKLRVPTREEFKELMIETNQTYLSVKGTYGVRFTSKVNGNYIFIPFAGYKVNGCTPRRREKSAYCWGTQNTYPDELCALCVESNDRDIRINSFILRDFEFTIRPVGK